MHNPLGKLLYSGSLKSLSACNTSADLSVSVRAVVIGHPMN